MQKATHIFMDSNGNPVFQSDDESISSFLSRYIGAKNITTVSFGVRAGIDPGTVSRITGRKVSPNLLTIVKIAREIGLSREGCLRLIEQFLKTSSPLSAEFNQLP